MGRLRRDGKYLRRIMYTAILVLAGCAAATLPGVAAVVLEPSRRAQLPRVPPSPLQLQLSSNCYSISIVHPHSAPLVRTTLSRVRSVTYFDRNTAKGYDSLCWRLDRWLQKGFLSDALPAITSATAHGRHCHNLACRIGRQRHACHSRLSGGQYGHATPGRGPWAGDCPKTLPPWNPTVEEAF